MSKKGFIVRYVTRGNILNGTDRWDFYNLDEAADTIAHLENGEGVRTYGQGLDDGDLCGLFETTQCDPANERVKHIIKAEDLRRMNPQELMDVLFPGEKELFAEEYLNGKWVPLSDSIPDGEVN